LRVGFAISLPEQMERLAPVARRLAGARWIIPAGRWPSLWLDSRQWTTDALRRSAFSTPAAPHAELDLVVLPGGIPPRAVEPWLHPEGGILPFHDERRSLLGRASLRLSLAPGWTPSLDEGCEVLFVGDPRLDVAARAATRASARAALGLRDDEGRRCIVLRSEGGSPALGRLAHALAQLRSEADLIVAPSAECWLRTRRPQPATLCGPGIFVVRDRLEWAELLAVADVVIAEPGKFALDALALGKAVLLMGSEPLRAGRFAVPASWPQKQLWQELPFVHEPAAVSRQLARCEDEAADLRRALAADLAPLVGPLDGAAAARAAAAIRGGATGFAMERALGELERRAARP
jgi:hypothetical protein